jgi:osmotically inducible lipoprotein OsmB
MFQLHSPATTTLRPVLLGLALVAGLSGCLDTRAERTVAGAAGGALISDALGGSAVTGAVVGGAAGYFCDELNVPGCRNR